MGMAEGLPTKKRAPAAAQAQLADRGLVLARAVAGLVHEAKNPLHNLALHLQLVAEKIARLSKVATPVEPQGRSIDSHLEAMRQGIDKVDRLLRSFGDLAEPGHGASDLGEASNRVVLVLGFEARRRRVELLQSGPASVAVPGPAAPLSDLLAHALLAFIWLASEGGRVTIAWSQEPGRALFSLRAEGGVPNRSEADPHLAAARRLSAEVAGEVLIEAEAGGQADARLSLIIPLPA
jgi:signal transduction histidine kinase